MRIELGISDNPVNPNSISKLASNFSEPLILDSVDYVMLGRFR